MKQIKVDRITDKAKNNEVNINEGKTNSPKSDTESYTTKKKEPEINDKDFSNSSDQSAPLQKKIVSELKLRKDALRKKLVRVSGALSSSNYELFNRRIGRLAK